MNPTNKREQDWGTAKPFLTSWCGGVCDNNCKVCLILSGKAELISADDKSHKLTYRIRED